MAITARKVELDVLFALVAAHNARSRDTAENLETYPHADVSSLTSGDTSAPVTTADADATSTATNLGTVKLRANRLKALLNRHFADDLAHKEADEDNVIESPDATDQGTANTLLNEIKAALIAHEADTDFHYTADTTNAVTAVDADGLSNSELLANDLHAQVNAHVAFGPPTPMINLVDA